MNESLSMTDDNTNLEHQAEELRSKLKEKRKNNLDKLLKDCVDDVASIGKVPVKSRKVLRGHLAKIYAFDWHFGIIVSASQDGKLIFWDSYTTLKRSTIPLKSSWVMSCAFSPSGNYVACGGLDNICTIYDLMGNESKARIKREFVYHQGYISSCVFLEETKVVSASGDSTCVIWDIESNKRIQTLIGHTSDVMKICLKPADVNILASGSCDKSCRIWDLRMKYPCVQVFATHEEDINSVAFHPSGNAIGTASDDGSCRIFDLSADNQISVLTFDTNGVKVGCTSLSFSLSGRLLFVGQDDHVVNVRDTLKGDVVCRLTDHDNRISCLSVSPDGSALCTGSWDNLLRIYA
uniref:Guanine nucleotide-binding protein G(I)/G(S)/G(T) subunit beta-1 (Trinotate prediction) n=1 Tax=Henneguya salminicola TaxID=69463 RepID=A0A6G3MFR8_HENSL